MPALAIGVKSSRSTRSAKDVAALRKAATQDGADVGCTLLQPVLQPGEIRGHPCRRVTHHGEFPLKGDAALLLGRERGQERIRRGVQR